MRALRWWIFKKLLRLAERRQRYFHTEKQANWKKHEEGFGFVLKTHAYRGMKLSGLLSTGHSHAETFELIFFFEKADHVAFLSCGWSEDDRYVVGEDGVSRPNGEKVWVGRERGEIQYHNTAFEKDITGCDNQQICQVIEEYCNHVSKMGGTLWNMRIQDNILQLLCARFKTT